MQHKHIYLVRHGQTEWSQNGRHTGLTDIPLTKLGEEQSLALGKRLHTLPIQTILCSPLQRAKKTYELCSLNAKVHFDPDLTEWNYGNYEGLTSAEIHKDNPSWSIFTHGAPGGESIQDLTLRAEKVLKQCHSLPGDIALFSHGHFLRALAALWIQLSVQEGRHLALSPASLSILHFERQTPVILRWNDTSHCS